MSAEKPNYNEVKHQLPLEQAYLPQPYEKKGTNEIYDQSSSVNGKDFVIGAFVGGVLGAAAALLLAPKAGKDLRSDVVSQVNSLKIKSADYSSVVKDKATDLTQKVQEQSSNIVEKAKSLKSQTFTPPTDDGTVSSEGEEPFDVMETIDLTIAEIEAEEAKLAAEEAQANEPKA